MWWRAPTIARPLRKDDTRPAIGQMAQGVTIKERQCCFAAVRTVVNPWFQTVPIFTFSSVSGNNHSEATEFWKQVVWLRRRHEGSLGQAGAALGAAPWGAELTKS